MARIITEQASHAFMVARKNFNSGNTSVTIEGDMVVMRLHGNEIAKRQVGSNSIQICNGGWSSNTTKERLNGLPGVRVCQKNFTWYLNSKEWDGSWVTI